MNWSCRYTVHSPLFLPQILVIEYLSSLAAILVSNVPNLIAWGGVSNLLRGAGGMGKNRWSLYFSRLPPPLLETLEPAALVH